MSGVTILLLTSIYFLGTQAQSVDVLCLNKPNSIYKTCQSSTQPTCENRKPILVLANCVNGCFCKPNYFLHNGNCISGEDCDLIDKNNKECAKSDPNSEFQRCQSSTRKTCSNPNPSMVLLDCRDMCVCKDGYLVDDKKTKKCILPKNC